MRILVVEDHADTVDVVQRMLKKDGYNVTAALTLADATTACREGKFDLLICDIGLPDGDGWGLAEMARTCGTKAIAFTGYGMPSDVEKARAAGFAAHLLKPVLLEDLRATIAAVMRVEKTDGSEFPD
jgi:CheY-like chemotaxis protein